MKNTKAGACALGFVVTGAMAAGLAGCSSKAHTSQNTTSRAALHTLSVTLSYQIASRSHMQKRRIITYKVEKGDGRLAHIVGTIDNNPYVSASVLFVSVSTGEQRFHKVKWKIKHDISGHPDVGRIAIYGVQLHPGMKVRVATDQSVGYASGYFVSARPRVRYDWDVRKLSGCLQVAKGLPYSVDTEGGFVVSHMNDPRRGFHGWCFSYNRDMSNNVKRKKSLKYFAVSTAASWKSVAEWMEKQFANVEAKPSKRITIISRQLGLYSGSVSSAEKVARVEKWIRHNLSYSGENALAYIPASFDYVIAHGYGDCKALTLVMVELLSQAGIDAHPVILSADDPYVFRLDSANLRLINHVVVYIPSTGVFYDPTVGTGKQLHGYQVMDTVSGKVVTVPFPRKKNE